ncbi:MerR family transcriptional regulator [Spirillospora sp. NPDC047279]|uniref:MerR family transcriptional regulator n=1 Tax=Spirillospora sp. NPDC047279 TaxID=3155478 RepID=UPI0033EA95EF
MDRTLGIGDLSRLTGVPVRTIRFYCDEGMLAARRSSGGHRRFDPDAVERLSLIRRMRALGLGLPTIITVLTGERSLDEAVAAERAVLDTELAALSWRRASLRAVELADPAERAARLELLAHAPGPAARDHLVEFWTHSARDKVSPEILEALVGLAVPDTPAEPTPDQVIAFAEMITLTGGIALAHKLRTRERVNSAEILDEGGLMLGVGEAYAMAAPALVAGDIPAPGPALDRFVEAHAYARGRHGDTPEFRRHLYRELRRDQDPHIDRYWDLYTEVTGTFVTLGRGQTWLLTALGDSLGTERRAS